MGKRKLYLALAKTTEESGWGTATKYLTKCLSKYYEVENLWDAAKNGGLPSKVDHTVVHCMSGPDFSKVLPVKGAYDIGYCFFEYEIPEFARENIEGYDLIFTGSDWTTRKMREFGHPNTHTLVQGVDKNIFSPNGCCPDPDKFVVYSGGKLEFRKGQDIVIAAMKHMQETYKDVELITTWANLWPEHIIPMCNSKLIRFAWNMDIDFGHNLQNLMAINELSPRRTIIYPEPVLHSVMAHIYKFCDVGLFPNRCEGGTNLVLMECMASGVPVIATLDHGHKDILDRENCIPLTHNGLADINCNDDIRAVWNEPNLDEVIWALEYAYYHRDEIREIGLRGSRYIRNNYTWQQVTERLMEHIP